MAEAVPLGELLHEEALFGLTGVRKVGVYPDDTYSRLDLPLRHTSSSPTRPDPLPTRLKMVGKNVQTLWWAELDRLQI